PLSRRLPQRRSRSSRARRKPRTAPAARAGGAGAPRAEPPMKSAWVEGEAQAAITQYAGHGADVALRVYTTRLLGRDPALVLHGGGNTSVKTRLPDLLGEEFAVL